MRIPKEVQHAGVCMISTINHCIEGVREREKNVYVEVMIDDGIQFYHSIRALMMGLQMYN
jgi:hypothetical protein